MRCTARDAPSPPGKTRDAGREQTAGSGPSGPAVKQIDEQAATYR